MIPRLLPRLFWGRHPASCKVTGSAGCSLLSKWSAPSTEPLSVERERARVPLRAGWRGPSFLR